MIARRSFVVRVGMAVFAVIALAYLAHFAYPAFVAAEHYRVDCRETSDQPPGFGKIYNCTFRNTTGAAVNDIEVTFTDRAIRVGPSSPIWACTGNSLPPERQSTTTITCRAARAGDAVAAGENFILTVRADIVPPLEWSWSLDGTLIPTTTHTPTPTPTPVVVRVRVSRTPTPSPTNTPPPPPTNLPPQDTPPLTNTDKPPEQPTQQIPPTATR
jgi:hypothetical protein